MEMDYKKVVRNILSDKKESIEQKIASIKWRLEARDYRDAINSNPLIAKIVNNNQLFEKPSDVYVREPYLFTEDFKKEFKWISNILENNLSDINKFLLLRNNFEKLFILEKYQEAEETLIEIESDFGISLWSIEANLMLEEYVKGSEANWNRLTYYLNEIKINVYEFIVNSSSKRVESKLSYESYVNQFQNDIDNIRSSAFIVDFFVFKNFVYTNFDYKFKSLQSVIFVSNIFSLVDQYLILIDVINYNISLSESYDKTMIQFINKAKNILTNDSRIINIYNIINDKKGLVEHENSADLINCLNLYYEGSFEESFNKAFSSISQRPTEFLLYEIYCKSLINLDLEFLPTGISSLVDNILNDVYNVLTFQRAKDFSFKKLLKYSLLLMNTNMGKGIFGFLSEIEGVNLPSHLIGITSKGCVSPELYKFTTYRKKVADNLKNISKNHCFEVYRLKMGIDDTQNSKISNSKKQSIIIESLNKFEKSQFQQVVNLLSTCNFIDEVPYYKERKNTLLYNSYLNLNIIRNALIIFGDSIFDENVIYRKINYTLLYQKILADTNKDAYLDLIDLPILYSLMVKEYDLYEVFDDFIYFAGFENILEADVDELIEKYSLAKVVFFFRNVAVINTLKYSTEYGSINKVEEDRVKILSILMRIDTDNKLVYQKEIDDIYRITSVRKVLKEVDEGRLYIDVNNLTQIQIKKFNDDFARFKEIEFSSSNQSLIGFNSSNTKNWEKAFVDKTEKAEKFNSADYLAFKSIYLESRDNFLFSKEYGLDSCLSTRIRHGALKNHIRSVFEKLDLVTSKYNDKYKDNDVWANQLIYYPELNTNIQSLLKIFSKDIDDYAVFIVEKLIQIQTEKTNDKEQALFRYNTNDDILFTFYTENKSRFISIDSVVEIILSGFVNYTLLDIHKLILDCFSNEIEEKYKSIIDNLIANLKEVGLINECELIPALMKSSTDIQNELQYISEWFYLNTTSSSSLLSIETILYASLDLTNKINPLFNLSPKINIKRSVAGYSNLIFVFNILLNNVIQHSKLENQEIDLEIDIDTDMSEKFVLVKFKNNLNSAFNYNSNRIKLEEVKQNWNIHDNIERSNVEGESGFVKIKRILLYEAMAKADKFDFDISENYITIVLYLPYKKPIQS